MVLKEKKTELIEFGKKLYTLRKSKKMTQMQMGEALGVDNRMISRYETGEAEMGALLYDKMPGVVDQPVDADAKTLLQQFAMLTPENKKQLIGLAAAMNQMQKNN